MARPNESELVVLPVTHGTSPVSSAHPEPCKSFVNKSSATKVREDEELYIDPEVNEHIWKRGIENPPCKVRLCFAFATMNPTSPLK